MSVYKVRMTVLEMVSANNPDEAKTVARETASDAGLTILQIEEPEEHTPRYQYGSLEGDLYS